MAHVKRSLITVLTAEGARDRKDGMWEYPTLVTNTTFHSSVAQRLRVKMKLWRRHMQRK